MDEILDVFRKTFSWLALEIVYSRICYYIGFWLLKILTLGKFTSDHQDEGIVNKLSLLGLVVLIALVFLLFS